MPPAPVEDVEDVLLIVEPVVVGLEEPVLDDVFVAVVELIVEPADVEPPTLVVPVPELLESLSFSPPPQEKVNRTTGMMGPKKRCLSFMEGSVHPQTRLEWRAASKLRSPTTRRRLLLCVLRGWYRLA